VFPWRSDLKLGIASFCEWTKTNHVFSGGGLFENIYLEIDIHKVSIFFHF
jgi:hypothetical protein